MDILFKMVLKKNWLFKYSYEKINKQLNQMDYEQ
ncbi:hypothetical protein J3D55_002265 [Chryseobacterium ginsenosidimutans]|nr:hypothetical protein [Chryseobacterium ginsenosidimutans]